jgi:hypothetical protein
MLIGFAGGCITHQPGIPYPKLFHRVLMRWFDERGIRGVRFSVAQDPYREPSLRVARLLSNNRADLIILHRSAYTFFTKPMAVFYANNRYILNPFLVRRRQLRSWNDYEQLGFSNCPGIPARSTQPPTTPNAAATSQVCDAETRGKKAPETATQPMQGATQANTYAEKPLPSFRLKDLPWHLGEWSGLLQWAIQDELKIVHAARRHCDAAGAELIVVGPGLRIGYPWANNQVQRLDECFQAWASNKTDVTYINLLNPLAGNRSPERLSAKHYCDAVHFNMAGHEHLAARLESPLLKRIEAR